MRRLPVLAPCLAAILALAAALPAPSQADLAAMVADLDAAAGPNRSSEPFGFERVGSRVVFFARPRPSERIGVWTTDGTPEGTRRLPGEAVTVQPLGVVGGASLWFALEETGNLALWRSGGLPGTTGRLVEDGVDEPIFRPVSFARRGDRLYFFRHGAGSSLELWATDGGAAGTRRIAALPGVGDNVLAMAVHRGWVYFRTADYVTPAPGAEGDWESWRLWRIDPAGGRARLLSSAAPGAVEELFPTAGRLLFATAGGLRATDGTPAGTGPVPGPPGAAGFELTRVVGTAGGKLLFGGRAPGRAEALWAADGTGPGTRRLAIPLSPISGLADLGGRALFAAADGDHGLEPWSTGGTPATTGLVADLCPGGCSSLGDPFPYDADLAAAGDRAYLIAGDGAAGPSLWVTDGTAAGTVPLLALDEDLGALMPRMTVDRGEVFLYLREPGGGTVGLWAADGAAGGTRRVAGLGPADPFPTYVPRPAPSLAALDGWIVTSAFDPRAGIEPFVVRRGGGGGSLLGDLARGDDLTGADSRQAVALGDRLVFQSVQGDSLVAWSTRGTAETTVELARMPLTGGFFPPAAAVAGGLAYLTAADLWATDGTPAGTVRLTDFAAAAPGSRVGTPVVDLGGRAFFGVTTGPPESTELWISDGTPAGTGPAGTSPEGFHRRVQNPVAVGAEVWFWAFDPGDGWQLRAVDASLGTVRRLTGGAHAFAETSNPPQYTRIGSQVYFLAPDDGWVVDLWRSDGTTEGAVRVPPPAGPAEHLQALAAAGDRLLLLVSDAPGTHFELLAGSGSGSDWVEVEDFGAQSVSTFLLTRESDVLLLVDEPGAGGGTRVWRSDGTAAGTAMAIDLVALGAPGVDELAEAGGRLFLSAGQSFGGREPWISDGSTATTRRLQEIAPGPGGSDPEGSVAAGGRVYFWADDGLHGRELWSLAPGEIGAPCRPSATALCLGDGRFRAELYRHDRAGERGDGRAVAWSSAAGAFWYYAHGNPEAVVKMVDGGAVNGHHWLFYGPLGDAYVALTVTDVQSGDARRYPAEPGPLPAFADLAAFPSAGAAAAGAPESRSEPEPAAGEPWVAAAPSVAWSTPGPCLPDDARLCLHGGRFAVELTWRDPAGAEHAARGFEHGNQAAYFAFHGAGDLQAALKILDGRAVNGRWWLFATSLTHLGHTLRVTDTATGAVHEYTKPAGDLGSLIDLSSLR